MLIDQSFHLRPVDLAQLHPRMADAVLQGAVVGEQHQPFAVVIQPAGRIDLGNGDVVGQAGLFPAAAELAQDVTGLAEGQGGQNRLQMAGYPAFLSGQPLAQSV